METEIRNETIAKIMMAGSKIVIRDTPFTIEVTVPEKPQNNFFFIRHEEKHMEEFYWSREN